jgi:hypothetical protein
MSPLVFRRWASGWAALVRHHDVPGYRELGRLARLALELAVLRDALRAPGTWGAALTCSAVGLAAQILVWRLDLAGWRRDALLCLPLLLAAPWIAAGRRRRIAGLLARRGLPARGQA